MVGNCPENRDALKSATVFDSPALRQICEKAHQPNSIGELARFLLEDLRKAATDGGQ